MMVKQKKKSLEKQINVCIDNELYLKKLKRNKRYKKTPTELNKYNNQVL